MLQIIETILADVCLDERVSDGIFQMENESHMDTLRDHLEKRGLTKEASIHVTNKMLEGKHPTRQLWQKDTGILVTWPTPQHMAIAVKKNPGKYINKDPKPPTPTEKEPVKEPIKRELPKSGDVDNDEEDEASEDDESLPKSDVKSSRGSVFNKTVSQGDKELNVEPPHGSDTPAPAPIPTSPIAQSAPRTPERIAAEKEVAVQIFKSDDNAFSKIEPSLSEEGHRQLHELYKTADSLGYKEIVTFLTPYIKL